MLIGGFKDMSNLKKFYEKISIYNTYYYYLGLQQLKLVIF